jgi:V8-like Glu-specific endopeptidase
MTFGVDDYEKAIARIFDAQGTVVGTGFLVAPGYVLTCAHVVLQAIGIDFDAKDYDAAVVPVGNIITLDFPMANGDKIQAEVLNAWRPYRIDSGDIAGLKLLAATPQQSKPMPMLRCSCADIQNQRHAVYGFANDNGDRTDAYKPKSNAPGGRFQLCKAGDPLDEKIEAGFSGAPVWNNDQGGVIGMVATAAVSKDERSKAFAISVESLHPVIQELFAHSLNDCICSHLEVARQRVHHAVEMAFWLCDTDGDRATGNDYLSRLLYLGTLPSRGWQQDGREIDRLTQFAIFLAVMDGLPRELVNEITAWVGFRGFDFDALYVRANQYRQERQVSADGNSAHLIVQIELGEQDIEDVYVSIWVVDDRDLYDPLEPRPPLMQRHAVAFTALSTFLETWLREESELDRPMIHCFVARHLLGCNLDTCETASELPLGSRYPLVMRTDLSQSPPGKQYRTRWEKKWQSFEGKQHSIARETFVRADCRNKKQLYRQLDSAEMAILENLSPDRVEQVFKFIADEVALPVALWIREADLHQELDRILDGTIINLSERIRRERLEAEDETSLGSHLSLVWEDPKVIPPTAVMPLI